MENQQQFQKAIAISYLAIAGLVAFILLTGLMKISGIYDLESKIKPIEYVIRGLSVIIGGIVFFVLYKHPQINSFMNEVAVELFTKVTWPSRNETWAGTGIVIVTVLIAGVFLGILDWIWSYLLRALI